MKNNFLRAFALSAGLINAGSALAQSSNDSYFGPVPLSLSFAMCDKNNQAFALITTYPPPNILVSKDNETARVLENKIEQVKNIMVTTPRVDIMIATVKHEIEETEKIREAMPQLLKISPHLKNDTKFQLSITRLKYNYNTSIRYTLPTLNAIKVAITEQQSKCDWPEPEIEIEKSAPRIAMSSGFHP